MAAQTPLSRVVTVEGRRYRVTVPYSLETTLIRDDDHAARNEVVVRTDLVPGPVSFEPAPTGIGIAAPDIPAALKDLGLEDVRPLVVRVYHDARDTTLAKPLLDAKATAAVAAGRRVLISFTAPWAAVAAGGLNDRLASYVLEVETADPTGELIDVCFGHEPETYGGRQNPTDFKAAFAVVAGAFHRANPARRIVLILQAWSYRTGGPLATWYPGPEAVDVLGADGYNWAGVRAGDDAKAGAAVFGPFAAVGLQLRKPMVIGEVNTGGADVDRAAWFAAAWRWMTAQGIEYAVVFDVLADAGTHDWRIPAGSSTASAVAAIAAM